MTLSLIKKYFPLDVLSGNKFTYRTRFTYVNYRNKWYRELLVLSLRSRKRVKRRVEIVRYIPKGCREYDLGNFIQGCKPIPDGLIKRGYIWDDSPKWVDISYKQIKDPKIKNGTTVTVHLD